jgi:hypothetical protein
MNSNKKCMDCDDIINKKYDRCYYHFIIYNKNKLISEGKKVCLYCHREIKNIKYDVCYYCNINKHKCIECDQMINKNKKMCTICDKFFDNVCKYTGII